MYTFLFVFLSYRVHSLLAGLLFLYPCIYAELLYIKKKKDKIMKKLLDGIQETYFRSIPGTSDNDTTLVQLR